MMSLIVNDAFNVKIMVKTRALGQALGRVIRRTLGREVSRDVDEGPQRQRPTISAGKQREAAPVAEDVQHVLMSRVFQAGPDN